MCRTLAAGYLMLALTACAAKHNARVDVPAPAAPQPPGGNPTPAPPDVPAASSARPVETPYTEPAPSPGPGLSEVGIASWYGHPYHGRVSASGEVYDMEQLTAAHRTLPFGTRVRVHNLDNDKQVDVRINDRGPFVAERIIDLSHAAAQAIGMIGPGVARVRLDIFGAPAILEAGFFGVQVGAFRYRENAERLRAAMEQRYGAAQLVLRPGDPALWRVLVGRAGSPEEAGNLLTRIRAEASGEFDQAFVVREDSAAQQTLRTSTNNTSAN